MRIDRRTPRQLQAIETRIKGAGYRKASRKSCRKYLRRCCRPSNYVEAFSLLAERVETDAKLHHRTENLDHYYERANSGKRGVFRLIPRKISDVKLSKIPEGFVELAIHPAKPILPFPTMPKMAGFSVPFGDSIEPIEPVPPALPEECNGTPYTKHETPQFWEDEKLYFKEEKQPIRKERKLAIPKSALPWLGETVFFNDGDDTSTMVLKPFLIDTVDDYYGSLKVIRHSVPMVSTSSRCSFESDIGKPETEKQKAFRQDCCKRWTTQRFGTNPNAPDYDKPLPVGKLVTTKDGRQIPDIQDSSWKLKRGRIDADSVHRYITASIRHAFKAFAGQLRHVYSSFDVFGIFQEFQQDCLQEICCNFRQNLEGLRHYRGTCDGISRISRIYMLEFGIREKSKEVDVASGQQKVKRNNKGRTQAIVSDILKRDLKFCDGRQEVFYKLACAGHSYAEIATKCKVSASLVEKEFKRLKAHNQ